MELYGRVRYAVQIEGLSHCEAARRFGVDPRTVAKMMVFSVPPGYRRDAPPKRPKLDPFVGIIDQIIADDKTRPAKQRHTSKRVFERLRDEHGYAGGLTIVKNYVCECRQRQREVFVPQRHDAGHAQADFGEALAVIGGVERKVHFFAMDLPHSDAGFVQAYPAETTEAFATLRRLLEARMGKQGKREFVQVLRLMEVFPVDEVAAGVRTAIDRGVIGFDAVKHLVLCRIERRPPRLDLTVYPYLPRASVANTSARTYLELLTGVAS